LLLIVIYCGQISDDDDDDDDTKSFDLSCEDAQDKND